MSGLLDLQDDLADTVMWLAENWSADLPTPTCPQTQYREGGERLAGVRLLVYCDSTPALIRVAELLGEPVVAAAEPDRYGTVAAGGAPIRSGRDRRLPRDRSRGRADAMSPYYDDGEVTIWCADLRRPAVGTRGVCGVCGDVAALQRRTRIRQ